MDVLHVSKSKLSRFSCEKAPVTNLRRGQNL